MPSPHIDPGSHEDFKEFGFIERVRAEESNPALDAFLDFVEADIKAHPDRLQALDGALHDRLKTLVGDIDIDLDEALSPEEE